MPIGSDTDGAAPASGGFRYATARSVAVVRLDHIGDHILGSGLFEALRRQLPQARITAIVRAQAAALYDACPWIDRCIALREPAPALGPAASGRPVDWQRALEGLQGSFDLVINPRFARDYYRASDVVRHLAAPHAIGFAQGDPESDTAYTCLVDALPGLHVSGYAQALLHAAGADPGPCPPVVWIGPHEPRRVRQTLARAGWNGATPLVVLAPGASQAWRQWPQHRVMALIDALTCQRRVRVVLAGSRLELLRYPALRAWNHPQVIDLRGQLSLPQLAACCHLAALFIGTDSGPKHVAAAAGTPVVEINHLPVDLDASQHAAWPTGPRWAASGVPTVQVRPLGGFAPEHLLDGTSIAAVTVEQVLAEARRFLALDRS